MSKQTSSRKKKLDQAQPIVQPSIDASPRPKINPHICLISPTYKVKTIKDYRYFMKKRKYSKKIEYSGGSYSIYSLYRSLNRDLLKIIRKMKYLQGFQTKMSQSFETHEKLYRTMRRVHHIALTIYDTTDTFTKKLKGLSKLNLTSLKVRLDTYFQTNKILSKAHKVLANSLKYLSNLKTLAFVIGNPSYGFQGPETSANQSIVNKNVASKFKRLKKIENLELLFVKLPNLVLDSFTQNFSHLSNLKSIKITAASQTQGKQLIQTLSKMQTLTSVTLYHYCEPDDLISLAMKVPSLRSITIKDDWLFDSKEMPSRDLINGKGLNVVQLHFDFPMDIDSDSDVEFIVNFLSAFPQLRSLNLHIQSGGEDKAMLAPIGKQINKLSQLQRLQLDVLLRSKNILSPFLSSINSLRNLNEISLTLKRDCYREWDVEIQDIYQALKIFLLQSKGLKKLNLNWDKFNQQCAECLKLVINELGSLNLDSVHFSYLPPSAKHDKEKILRVLENIFVTSSVEIKNLTIIIYWRYHQTQDCSDKMPKLQKAVQSNQKIKNFTALLKYNDLF